MQPAGPLMKEHRRIERAVPVLRRRHEALAGGAAPDEKLLRKLIDFFRSYVDRCHHGKEEDILFAALGRKDLTDEHRATMDRLVHDHEQARQAVAAIADALEEGQSGPAGERIAERLGALAELYAEHIRVEDKEFFLPAMGYLDDDEQQQMLEAFARFDRNLYHERYEGLMSELEAAGSQAGD